MSANLQYSKSASNLNNMKQQHSYLNASLGERGGTHQPTTRMNNYVEEKLAQVPRSKSSTPIQPPMKNASMMMRNSSNSQIANKSYGQANLD